MRPSHHELVYPPLAKKGKRGFTGFPVVTVAFYGADDLTATKAVAALVPAEGAEPAALERFAVAQGDARRDPNVGDAILAFCRSHGAASVLVSERIIGCPHEEGVDYPAGERCPSCPFWHERDRWSGERLAPPADNA